MKSINLLKISNSYLNVHLSDLFSACSLKVIAHDSNYAQTISKQKININQFKIY